MLRKLFEGQKQSLGALRSLRGWREASFESFIAMGGEIGWDLIPRVTPVKQGSSGVHKQQGMLGHQKIIRELEVNLLLRSSEVCPKSKSEQS